MPDIQEIVELLGAQNRLLSELRELTLNIQQSLMCEDVERLSKDVEQRRILADRVKKMQKLIGARLRQYTTTDSLPQQIAGMVGQGKETLLSILEIDRACEKLGKQIAGELIEKSAHPPGV